MYLSQIFSLGLWLVFSFSVNVFFRGRHNFKVMCLGISGQGAVANTWFTFFLTHPQLLGIYYFAVSIGIQETQSVCLQGPPRKVSHTNPHPGSVMHR